MCAGVFSDGFKPVWGRGQVFSDPLDLFIWKCPMVQQGCRGLQWGALHSPSAAELSWCQHRPQNLVTILQVIRDTLTNHLPLAISLPQPITKILHILPLNTFSDLTLYSLSCFSLSSSPSLDSRGTFLTDLPGSSSLVSLKHTLRNGS